EAGGRVYLFDDLSHYVTNKSGSQQVSMILSFPAAQLKGQRPTSLFFKGVRLPLPAPTDDFASIRAGSERATVDYDRNATSIPNSYLKADRRIGVVLNRNTLASGIKAQKDSITFSPGADIPARSQGSVNKSLRVEFLYELPGTKLVKLDVSREKSPVDIWGDLRDKAGEKADLVLVDDQGNTFTPIGWLHTQATEGLINVKLDPRAGVKGVGDLPRLSTAGRDDLDVLYTIPIGSRIVAIKLGDETVGVTDLTVD
ncbi:MAG: hypothetical protein VX672_08215, partial [Planctomycetota bacterium]|nr:hypothetical protein [Planctomycetota bacterium]